MHTVQHTAIVTKASDYKEYDKLVRLFTVDGGMISATLKGVKRPNAKLKFAAQPFAFCEYTMNEKGGFYTVTGAVPVESLYALAYDPDHFFAASLMLETVDRAVSDLADPASFVYLLKLFNALLYQGKCAYAAAALFLYRLLANAGYIDSEKEAPLLKNLTPATLPPSGSTDKYLPLVKSLAAVFENRFGIKLLSLRAFAKTD